MEDRRLIEETFPIREVSEESVKEKNIRHGHISTLHIWWARRPLASSRATAYATLIPAAKNPEELQKKKQFIVKLAKWENSLDKSLLQNARKDILEANGGKVPKVLDPFSGGGAIPLEALRLGCETYASDYNPVAVLIEKCTLEYPQKYGERLVKDVKRWGEWVLEEAKKELKQFYPNDKEEKEGYFAHSKGESIPVGYIWARTIKCQNPKCEAEIPLMRQFWLAKKPKRKISLYPYVKNNKVEFKIIDIDYEEIPKDFNPEKGTVRKAIAECLVCGSMVRAKDVRKQFHEGKSGQRMVAVVLYKQGIQGKMYRIAREEDMQAYKKAEEYLHKKRKSLMSEFGIDPVPDEPTPEGKGRGAERAFSVRNYNMNTWGDLFNSRQKLALIVFVEKVRNVYEKMIEEGYEEEYAKVVTSYLAIIFDRLADKNSELVLYNVVGEKVEHVFGRQTLSMVWDYIEVNPFTDVGWINMLDWVTRIVEHCSQMQSKSATVFQSSATQLSYPDNYFDAVFTDPPYYDNVPYSYLSDFFYVWLKRTIGDLYPELFVTPLTPKKEEIVAYSNIEGGFESGERFFEEMLKKSFSEIHRVLKPNGIAVIVYAHKSTAGWETLINSLLDSGLVVTAAWPVNTEMKVRLRAKESAALASSIYMIARKMQREPTRKFKEVKEELTNHLAQRLESLWKEGIAGADFFISAIGSAIVIFGKYKEVIDYERGTIRAAVLLDEVRKITTDYAVKQVLHNGFAEEISPLTRFYVLWRWAYGEAKVPFDDARKLAQGVGIDLANQWNKGFIQKNKEFIRLRGAEERKVEELANSRDMIDVLHHVLLLWNKGRNDDLLKVLKESGYGNSDTFYRVAQAISESLPNNSNEKKLLEGFLAGKERLSREVRKESGQRRLFE